RADDRARADHDRRDQRAVRSDERAFADLGPVFEEAVIIAGDRTGADIGFRADLGIADIGEVVGLGALAEPALLHLDEIADLRTLADAAPGPQPCIGADLGAAADRRAFDMAEAAERDPVFDHGPRPEEDIGLYHHVAADDGVMAEPDG